MSKKTADALSVEPPSIFDVAPDAETVAAPVADVPSVDPAAVGIVDGKKIESGSQELAAPVRRTGFEFRHIRWGF